MLLCTPQGAGCRNHGAGHGLGVQGAGIRVGEENSKTSSPALGASLKNVMPVSATDTRNGERVLDNSEVFTRYFRDGETLLLQILSS